MSLAIKAGLIQRNWKWLVVGFPRFEFAGHVVPPPRRAQFGDDAGMLCREPVPKLVKRFDGRENGGGDFPFHLAPLLYFKPICNRLFGSTSQFLDTSSPCQQLSLPAAPLNCKRDFQNKPTKVSF